jgi:hypothetical protein
MRRVDERVAVTSEIRPTKVIGQNDKDVGAGPRVGLDHRRQTKKKEAGKHPNDAKVRVTSAKGTSKGEYEHGETLTFFQPTKCRGSLR